jgi:hypothetical protein
VLPPLAAASEVVAPSGDVCAGHGTEFLRLLDAGEAHEVLHGGLVGAAGLLVGQVGEPLDLRRHVGQPVEFARGERSAGGQDL